MITDEYHYKCNSQTGSYHYESVIKSVHKLSFPKCTLTELILEKKKQTNYSYIWLCVHQCLLVKWEFPMKFNSAWTQQLSDMKLTVGHGLEVEVKLKNLNKNFDMCTRS